nr:protein phosphatase 2C domain-containing protein [Rhodoferax sp.]
MQTTLIDEAVSTSTPTLRPASQCSQAQLENWHVASCSSTGLRHLQQRHLCEDSLGHRENPHGHIAVALADGVSGGACGQVASAAAVGYCLATPSPQLCSQALDDTVQAAVAQHTQAKGATTLAAAWLDAEGQGQLLRVGDCRIYHWRAAHGELKALTTDETYTELGELPPRHIPPDNPARMLGIGQPHLPIRQPVRVQPGDVLLLCSDGLHAFVSPRELAGQFMQIGTTPSGRDGASVKSLVRLSRRLVCSALTRGSDDDVSVLLLSYCPQTVE